MADPNTVTEIPPFEYDSNGKPRTRLEMEQWLRDKYPKIHWLRIRANKDLGLPKQISWDMKEIVLRHWMLDEMVRRKYILGDVLGVNSTQSNDEAETRQFIQRLASMIQAGNAIQPQYSEGVDMTTFQPPPPPTMGVPVGDKPTTQTTQVGTPPPLPPPPTFPQAGKAPVVLPTPPGAGPAAEATPAKRGRRPSKAVDTTATEIVEMPAKAENVFVPPSVNVVPMASPFSPAPTHSAVTHTEIGADVKKEIDDLRAVINGLKKDNLALNYKLDVACVALAVLGRTMTGKPGTASVESWLGELGVKLPEIPK
jgi:hypothetical protein